MPGWTPPGSTATRKYLVPGAYGTHGGAGVGYIPTGLLGHLAVPMGTGTGLRVPMMGCRHPAPPLSPQGLQDCVTDLLQPFQGDAIDMVAGIDAMGFILGEQGHGCAQGPHPSSLQGLTAPAYPQVLLLLPCCRKASWPSAKPGISACRRWRSPTLTTRAERR